MVDPVFATDGYTYERRAIEEHFGTSDGERPASPMTGEPLPSTALIPCRVVRSMLSLLAGPTSEDEE